MKTLAHAQVAELLALSDGGQKTAPEWFRLLPLGRVHSSKGEFVVDAAAVDQVRLAFAALERDLVIDYEHQTLGGEWASPDGKAPAAGWVHEIALRDDGLWVRASWTDKAKAAIEAREYRYLSPVTLIRDGRLTRLHSVALTNDPAITGMDPLVNSGRSPEAGQKEGEAMEELKKLLGLADQASDADVKASVEGLLALKAGMREVLGAGEQDDLKAKVAEVVGLKDAAVEALALKADATATDLRAQVLALKNPDARVPREEFEALKAKLADREASDLVELALKDGKITPASREWAMGLAKKDAESFKAFTASAPKIVTEGRIAAQTGGAAGGHGLTDGELLACKALGLTPEQFRKHNQVEA